jgi:hypothetical protein
MDIDPLSPTIFHSMTRTRQMVSEMVGEELDLGDGFVMRRVGDNMFKVYSTDGTLALSIYLVKTRDSEIVAVRDIMVMDDKFYGLGLGRRALIKLVELYGQLRSDPTGQTSDDAERMWKSIGALPLLNADRGFGQSHYAFPNPTRE